MENVFAPLLLFLLLLLLQVYRYLVLKLGEKGVLEVGASAQEAFIWPAV